MIDETLSPKGKQLQMNTNYMNEINMIIINTKVIDETLSPTWDQLLLIPSVLVYGTRCHTYTYMTILSIYIMLLFFLVYKVLFRDKHRLSEFVFGSMFAIFTYIVREDIKMSPPITVIEVWDQDKVI